MLFGKFGIDFGSTQVYTTKHCAEPFRKVDLYSGKAKAEIGLSLVFIPFLSDQR